MTKLQIDALVLDWTRLLKAVADPAVLPELPQEPAVLRAVPDPCRPFQARWILGNCTKIFLRRMREANPAIVALQQGRMIRYKRDAVCKVAGRAGV